MKKKFIGFIVACLTATSISSFVTVANAETTTNLAAGKIVTASGEIMGKSTQITDGDKDSNDFVGVTQNLQWIQIDLGKSYDINKIKLWHYYLDGRKYHDVIARVSNDANFVSGVATVFNNDTDNSAGFGKGADAEYAESSEGNTISFNATNARYVRLYTNGSSANIYNHYVEVEVYGDGSTTTPDNPDTPGKTYQAWDSTKVYVNGDIVSYNNNIYKARWWTQGNTPGSNEVWKLIGSDNSIPKPTDPTLETGKIMFDDFNYTSPSDSKLSTNGWSVRNNGGGPGPSGSTFSKDNISFIADTSNASNKLMRLTASSNGTASGTSQAEINTSERKFLNGTYAARVRFTDTPVSGTDGAAINETFFTISPLEGYRDPKYSELDFEYLPNGGWGDTGGIWNTSWHTYTPDPWYQDSKSTFTKKSFEGWHDLVVVVADGYNTYYIDGVQVAKNGPANGQADYFLPRKDMTINFNLWFITGDGEPALVNSKYIEDVDWVFHEKDTALTANQVKAKIDSYRSQGVTFKDTVD